MMEETFTPITSEEEDTTPTDPATEEGTATEEAETPAEETETPAE